MSYQERIQQYTTELAKQNRNLSEIQRKIRKLRIEIIHASVPVPNAITALTKLETAYARLTELDKILEAPILQNSKMTLSVKYARAFVEQHKVDALENIMLKLVEYQPPTPQIAQGLRMNCEDTALAKTTLSMTKGDITTLELVLFQKEYNDAVAAYSRILQKYEVEYPVSFGIETKERKILEQECEKACLEQNHTTSTIDWLKGELKRLAHDSVQGNLSALPMEYRIARNKGIPVPEAIVMSEAAAQELAMKSQAVLNI
jgi:hypothetical protein